MVLSATNSADWTCALRPIESARHPAKRTSPLALQAHDARIASLVNGRCGIVDRMPSPHGPSLDASIGLTTSQAEVLRREYGPNELPSARPRSIWRIALQVAAEPMILLLLASGGVYLLL